MGKEKIRAGADCVGFYETENMNGGRETSEGGRLEKVRLRNQSCNNGCLALFGTGWTASDYCTSDQPVGFFVPSGALLADDQLSSFYCDSRLQQQVLFYVYEIPHPFIAVSQLQIQYLSTGGSCGKGNA